VISYRHPDWGEAVKALVVAKKDAVIEPESVIQFCKDRLASYKAPKSVEVVSNLPRTALGKIDRGKLELAKGEVTKR
jgi:acyl-CoA synthetase (AMP-forming)/AMP-acid ligase II